MTAFTIDHVQLAMPPAGEEIADEFYVTLLGFTREEKPPSLAQRGGRWYERDGARLHLGVDPNSQPSPKAHVAFRTENFAALRDTLTTSGVKVQDDNEIPGVERFYTWDPFGNRIEILRG